MCQFEALQSSGEEVSWSELNYVRTIIVQSRIIEIYYIYTKHLISFAGIRIAPHQVRKDPNH